MNRLKFFFIILIALYFLVSCNYSIIEAKENCRRMVKDTSLIAKTLKIKPFRLIKNQKFPGILLINNHKSKKQLYFISGKYNNKTTNGTTTVVIVLSCSGNSIRLESKFEFYAETIDFLFLKDEKIYVVFKDETDLFGWICWKDGKFSFEMFEDSEL